MSRPAPRLDRRRFLRLGLLGALGLPSALAGCRSGTSRTIPNGTVAIGSTTVSPASTNASQPPVDAPPDPGLGAEPFRLGVNSGDPLPDAVMLWTRLCLDPTALDGGLGPLLDTDVVLAWDIARDRAFDDVVASALATAPAADGHSVHVDATGLAADGEYFYRFRLGPWTSALGRTRTAPSPDARVARLVVAAASCQHYELGTFVAHRHLAEEQVDLIVFLGDFIYEGAAQAGALRAHPAQEASDLDGYRLRYAWYRQDPDLQAAQASAPWAVVWDDHEVQNNYAADQPATGPDPAFEARRAAAYRAWWENQPVRLPRPEGSELRIHRELAWGRLAHLLLLDGRSHRSPQVCGGSVGAGCADLADDTRTMLGAEQEQWLQGAFERSAATSTWTVLGNQTALSDLTVPVGAQPITLFDQWDGYPAARRRLLRSARTAGVANLVALTGDLHCSIAADLGAEGVVAGSEILASSISSVFAPGGGALFELGLSLLDQVKLIDTRHRGYVRAEFSDAEATFAFRHVTDARDAASTITTTSRWKLTNGVPGLRKA